VRWGPLIEMDLADCEGLQRVFRSHKIHAVLHFAGFASVAESLQAPALYFQNNFVNTLTLLEAMRSHGVDKIVFSSSCTTYGYPDQVPIPEGHKQAPISPYGESKLMVENTLTWFERAYGLRWVALRYFNAAGADPEGEVGEAHHPETHLIPRAIAAACGDGGDLEIFGADYDTQDGTAVRDYIHVSDLAVAHVKAVKRLIDGESSAAFNLGIGKGYSVRQVIGAVQAVAGRRVPVRLQSRRAGDAPAMVADTALAERILGWAPQYTSLEPIVSTAWQWYERVKTRGLPRIQP